MKTTVSIIVPIYNIQNYISKCIESVMVQTYDQWELILVNDGSTDASKSICERYASKDERIVTINQDHRGVSAARNKGIGCATGEYVTFLDGDDYWMRTDVLEEIVNRNEDLIYATSIKKEYPNGKIRIIDYSGQFNEAQKNETVLAFFTNRIQEGWHCCRLFIKRSILEEHAVYFDTSARIGEDADWFYRICISADSVGLIGNVYYNYRMQRPGSIMTNKSRESIASFFDVVDKWKQLAEENAGMQCVYQILCNNAFSYINTIAVFDRESRRLLLNALIKCGAYENAETLFAHRVRRLVKIIGMHHILNLLGMKYRMKKYGSYFKSRILR